MPKKLKSFNFLILCLLAVMIFIPNRVMAQQLPPLPTPDDCANVDHVFANNVTSALQGKVIAANTFAKQYPIANSINQCTQNLAAALHALTSLTSPFDGIGGAIIQTIIESIIAALITDVCQAVVGTINNFTSNLEQFATICLPIPSPGFGFGSLGLPPCLGTGLSGSQIPLLSAPQTPAPGQTPATPLSSYFSHLF